MSTRWRLLLLVGTLNSCALDFGRFLAVGEGGVMVTADGAVVPSEASVTLPDGSMVRPDTGGGGGTVPRCPPPALWVAVESLFNDGTARDHARIVRVSFAGPRPERCMDLTGDGDLDPIVRSAIALPGGRYAIGGGAAIQVGDVDRDRVVAAATQENRFLQLTATGMFVLRYQGTQRIAVPLLRQERSTPTLSGVAVFSIEDASLVTYLSADATATTGPLARTYFGDAAAHPSNDSHFLVMKTGADVMASQWALDVDSAASPGTMFTTFLNGRGAAEGLPWGIGTVPGNPDDQRIAWVTRSSGSPARSGVVMSGRITGAGTFSSAVERCRTEICPGTNPEYIHALPDPTDENSAIMVCGDLSVRSVVRIRVRSTTSGMCETIVDGSTPEFARRRFWFLTMDTAG